MKYPVSLTDALGAAVRRAIEKQKERRIVKKALKAAKRPTRARQS